MALSPHALRLKVLTMALTAVWRREWGENKDPLLARCLDNKWLKQPAGIRVCCKLGLWQCDPTNFDTRCENFIRRNFDFLPAEITFTIVCGTAPHCLTYLNDYNNRWYTIVDTFPLFDKRDSNSVTWGDIPITYSCPVGWTAKRRQRSLGSRRERE